MGSQATRSIPTSTAYRPHSSRGLAAGLVPCVTLRKDERPTAEEDAGCVQMVSGEKGKALAMGGCRRAEVKVGRSMGQGYVILAPAVKPLT